MNAPMYKILQPQAGTQRFPDLQQKVQPDLVLSDEFKLLTKAEAANVLRVKECTISAWISKKRLSPTRVGSRATISLAELKRFLRESNRSTLHTPDEAADKRRFERLVERCRRSLAHFQED